MPGGFERGRSEERPKERRVSRSGQTPEVVKRRQQGPVQKSARLSTGPFGGQQRQAFAGLPTSPASPMERPFSGRKCKQKESNEEFAYNMDDYTLDEMMRVDSSRELEPLILSKPHFKLPALKRMNYHTWAWEHEIMLKARGIWGVATGDLPGSQEYAPARRRMLIGYWIRRLLASKVEQDQKQYVVFEKRAKGVWESLIRKGGASGRRLLNMV